AHREAAAARHRGDRRSDAAGRRVADGDCRQGRVSRRRGRRHQVSIPRRRWLAPAARADPPSPTRLRFHVAGRRGRERDDGEPVGMAVEAALSALGVDAGWRALAAWAEVAGPTIAARTVAERIVDGVLHVRVASGSWAHELAFFRGELLARLRARAGRALRDVRFHVGEVPAAAPPRTEPPHPAREMAPPAEPIREAVEAASAAVPDPELACALRALGLRLVR